ncbi:MAG TPA: LytTR family DNA-binding domain-containing protein [Bacteroidia bacterium]|nr:LytTR family DNA-binding domain-containing protein [Bacteroidia bacterium]
MEEIILPTAINTFIFQIEIKEKKRIISINTDDIIWLEADANYVKIHTKTAVYIKKTSLKELELQLDPEVFIRIHRSAIISFKSIDVMFPYFKEEYIIVLKNEKTLRLSRGYTDKLELIQKKIKQKSA